MSNFQSELENLLPHNACGIEGDPADGFGTCTCGAEAKRKAITTLVLETLGEDVPLDGLRHPDEDEYHYKRNQLRAELRTKFTNPKKGDEI